MPPIAIDLFCGAGGMSLGFEQAGFRVVAAVDANPKHTAVHDRNFPFCKSITDDMTTVTGAQLRSVAGLQPHTQIDVLFGGPPCQGLSVMGHRDEADPRNQLLFEFARLVGELQPRYFVLENVDGLLSGYGLTLVQQFTNQVQGYGYTIVTPIQILNAADFGVPQVRLRTFILGHQNALPAPTYPQQPAAYRAPTVWNAISDLRDIKLDQKEDVWRGPLREPSPYAEILRGDIADPTDHSWVHPLRNPGLTGCLGTKHTTEVIKRFRKVKPGHVEKTSRYYRLTWNGASRTLRAGTGSDRGSFTAARHIHPIHPRCITVRESARLQSFPDWFVFDKTRWHSLQQLGNAVPPFLARAVARQVYNAILQANQQTDVQPMHQIPDDFGGDEIAMIAENMGVLTY